MERDLHRAAFIAIWGMLFMLAIFLQPVSAP